MLRADLTRLPEEVDILDEPTVHHIAPPGPGPPGGTTVEAEPDHVECDGWGYHADELDEDNFIDYGLDPNCDESGDELDKAAGGDGSVRIWDAATGELRTELAGHPSCVLADLSWPHHSIDSWAHHLGSRTDGTTQASTADCVITAPPGS